MFDESMQKFGTIFDRKFRVRCELLVDQWVLTLNNAVTNLAQSVENLIEKQ